jgi:hypothetical protein
MQVQEHNRSNAVTGSGPRRVVQRKKGMEAFDRLPLQVREAIRYAKFTFSAETAEDLLVRYRLSPREVAEFIVEMDDAYLKKVREAEARAQEEGE